MNRRTLLAAALTLGLAAAPSARAAAIDLSGLASLANLDLSQLANLGIPADVLESFSQLQGVLGQVQMFAGYLNQFQNINSLSGLTGTACDLTTKFLGGTNPMTNYACTANQLQAKAMTMLDAAQNTWNNYQSTSGIQDFVSRAMGDATTLLNTGSVYTMANDYVASLRNGVEDAQVQLNKISKAAASTTALGGELGGEATYGDALINDGLLQSESGAGGAILSGMYREAYRAAQSEGQAIAIQQQSDEGLANIQDTLKAMQGVTDETTKRTLQRRIDAANANSVREVTNVQVDAIADLTDAMTATSDAGLKTAVEQAKLASNTNNLLGMTLQQEAQDRANKIESIREEGKIAAAKEIDAAVDTTEKMDAIVDIIGSYADGSGLEQFGWNLVSGEQP